MPPIEFFESVGLFGIPQFFDADACRAVVDEMLTAKASEGEVVRVQPDGLVARLAADRRKVRDVEVSTVTVLRFVERVREVRSDIGRHYDTELKRFEHPQFLTYREGDFFAAHTDGDSDHPDVPEHIRQRRFTMILFLNEGEYTGGKLILYGAFGDGDGDATQSVGLPVDARPGDLITFPSRLLHEVQPVTSGLRHSAVSWFVSPSV
jgi:predicted 2-oxoglutarate/Fe(II)-dependent dioxygenase YbiX